MNSRVIDWYKIKHPEWELLDNNKPLTKESLIAIEELENRILHPIEDEFGEIIVTYGFTSFELYKKIQKLSPEHTAPDLDQHSSYERNSRGNLICKRGGIACDFFVKGYENNMGVVSNFIVEKLDFDRIYFYGIDRPVHISISPDNSKFVQYMLPSKKTGLRYPGKRFKKEDLYKVNFIESSLG